MALLAGAARRAGLKFLPRSSGRDAQKLRLQEAGEWTLRAISRETAWHDACLRSGMSPILSFRDLDAWRLSMNLVDAVIAATPALPRVEFDLRRQINRAVVSIPSNVAEGWKRKRRRAACQNHVSIALGSHAELETQLEICFRNGFLQCDKCGDAWALLMRTGPLLERLHDSLD